MIFLYDIMNSDEVIDAPARVLSVPFFLVSRRGPIRMNTVNPIITPLINLLRSRKFLLLVLDAVISILLKYTGVDPEFIAIIQPVFVALIVSIAYEDGKKSEAAGLALQQPLQLVTMVGENNGHSTGRPSSPPN